MRVRTVIFGAHKDRRNAGTIADMVAAFTLSAAPSEAWTLRTT